MNKIKDLKLKKKIRFKEHWIMSYRRSNQNKQPNNALKMSVFEVILVRISPH